MAEVTDAPPRAAANEDARTNAAGSHIWYELITPDPEGAKAFYDSVVGWDIGPKLPGDMDYRMIGRSDGGNAGGVLGLTKDMADRGAKPIWLGYVAVDDVDATLAQVEAKSGKVLMSASDIPDVGRIAMVADPQGAPFYVMKPSPPVGDEKKVSDVFSTTEEQRVGWNELSTSDPTAALEFYTALFGWEKGDAMPMGEAGDYQFINRNGQMIGAIYKSGAGAMPEEPPHWRHYIRVPSIAKAVEAVKAGGGSVATGPHEVPGGDQIIIGRDPQGAEFSLVGKA